MALDFPNAPTNGQSFTAPNGVIWTWDGVKWVNGTGVATYAPINSPAFTGNPTAPTPAPGDADTSIATTAFVAAATSPGKFVPVAPQGNIALSTTEPGLVAAPTVDGAHIFSAIDSTYQIGFSTYWDGSNWRHRKAGFCANLTYDPAGGALTLYGNVSGSSDATATGTLALFSISATGTLSAYGGVTMNGTVTAAAASIAGQVTASNVVGATVQTGAGGLVLGYGFGLSADASNSIIGFANNSYLIFTKASESFGFNINSYGNVLNFTSGTWTFPTGRVMSSLAAPAMPTIGCLLPGQIGAGLGLNADGYISICQLDGVGNAIQSYWTCHYGASYVQSLWATAYKPGGGAWSDSSDERLKRNVEEYKTGLADVLKLRPITYEYNGLGETADDGARYHGFIAQEAVTVMPEMVGRKAVKLNKDDEADTDILTVNVTPLIFALVNAVKELTARLDALQTSTQGK